jgi:hypothetical protein
VFGSSLVLRHLIFNARKFQVPAFPARECVPAHQRTLPITALQLQPAPLPTRRVRSSVVHQRSAVCGAVAVSAPASPSSLP